MNNKNENVRIQSHLINELRDLDRRLGRLADNAPERESVERDRTVVLAEYDRVTADIHAYERTLDDEEFVLHGAAVDGILSRPVLRRTDRILLPEDPAAPQIPVWPDPGWDTAAAPAAPAAAAPLIPVVVPDDWLVHALPPTPPPRSPRTTPSAPVRRRSPRRGGKTKRKGKKRKSTKKRKGKSAKKTKKRK